MRWRLLFSSLAEEKTEAEKDQVAPDNSYWATQLELKPKPFRFRSHALTCQIYGLSIYGLLRTDGFSHQNIVQSDYIVYLPGFHHATSFWKAFAWFPHLAKDGWSQQVVPVTYVPGCGAELVQGSSKGVRKLHQDCSWLQKAGGGTREWMLSAPPERSLPKWTWKFSKQKWDMAKGWEERINFL